MSPRPPRTNRQEIVRAAIALIDADGIDSFSMRRLASAMGVDPMTLYHHLPNRAALLDAVVDELWSSIELGEPAPGTEWRESLAGLAHRLRGVLLDRPRLIALVGTRPAVTPHMLTTIDRVLGWLDRDGLAPAEALRLLDCVTGYVVGKVQGELRRPVGGPGVSVDTALEGTDGTSHPHLTRALATGYGWSPDEEFARGLDAMLGGWGGGPVPPERR